MKWRFSTKAAEGRPEYNVRDLTHDFCSAPNRKTRCRKRAQGRAKCAPARFFAAGGALFGKQTPKFLNGLVPLLRLTSNPQTVLATFKKNESLFAAGGKLFGKQT